MTMTMTIDIEWTGKSHTSQIDYLDLAFAAARAAWINAPASSELYDKISLAEAAFANVAFSDWSDEPDNWSLTFENYN